jgi:hypothetical protein
LMITLFSSDIYTVRPQDYATSRGSTIIPFLDYEQKLQQRRWSPMATGAFDYFPTSFVF